MIRIQMDWPMLTVARRNSQTKYAVHGGGATKPPSPVSPSTASMKRPLVLCLHYTVLLFCVAIAARAPFEGVTTFDSYRACV